MKIFASREDRRRALLFLALVTVVFVALYVLTRRYAPFLFDTEELREWLSGFGILAPLVFMGLQALQVVVAPIPGQVVALASGYLFGSVAGTVYSLAGVLVGSAVAFQLAKRYGRAFVEDVLHEDVVARFDGFVERVGLPGLFALVIIPGLPDDAICFLSGLTTWRLRTFLAVIAIGRLPAYVLTVYAGGELAAGRVVQGALLLVGLVVLSVGGYYRQATIRDVIQRLESRLPY